MGLQDVKKGGAGELREFMKLLLRDLRALEKMLELGAFESDVRRIGAEQELFLVDRAYKPATRALEVLDAIGDDHFTTELGLYNIEYNLDPVEFGGNCLSQMETQLESLLQDARAATAPLGVDVILTGILPTLQLSDLTLDNMTPNPRYFALNDALCRERGGLYTFMIKGADEFRVEHDNVMLESCNTSFQVHFQVGPDEFAKLYNIAQVCAAPALSVATNSPMLFGKRLWRETRIALFQQSIDTRTSGKHMRERPPRVSFGSKWVDDSVLEVFREDVTRFRVLLNTEVDEDPLEVVHRGEAPSLKALRLHNGTVYRWTRPCYGVVDGKPHLRIENRVLPAGPSLLDEMANATFWFGLMTGLASSHSDIRDALSFDDAKTNFMAAARDGLGASFTWTDGRSRRAEDLVLHELLPMSREALVNRGLDASEVTRYLDVIEERVRAGRTGAAWALESFNSMRDRGALPEKLSALTAASIKRQREGRPVHEWPLASLEEGANWSHDFSKVSQFMATDLYTVNKDELVELVISVMDWQMVRHVPVEDDQEQFVGLVTYRTILRYLSKRETEESVPVSEIMLRDVKTVGPQTATLEAIRIMRENRLSCLPVVEAGRLVGMVTQEDFLEIARELLEEGLRSSTPDQR